MMHGTPTDMIPPLNRMDLGFYEQDYNGHRIISHGGDTQYFHSYLHLLLDDHVGFFVSVNSAGREGAALRGPLFEGFLNRYFPAPHVITPIDEATAKARSWAQLPGAAVKYVRRIEELIGCPVALLSTSPEREDTILMQNPFEA